MTVYYANSLYHHGIKGQKWGVRRFQNKDGSLTAAGRKRYDDDSGPREKKQKEYKIPKNKSLHRLKIEEKYKAKGMSEKEAEQAAAKRIRGEQFAVGAAAVTVAACVAYNKYKNHNVDKVLKNVEFHRVMTTDNPDAPIRKDGARYVAYNKNDRMKYRGIYGDQLNQQNRGGLGALELESEMSRRQGKKFGPHKMKELHDARAAAESKKVYDMTMKSKGDIKVASEKRARETFAKLYKNDPEFRKNLEERIEDNRMAWFGKKGLVGNGDVLNKLTPHTQAVKVGELTDKELKTKAYDMFNILLVDSDERGRANQKKFYDALKEQGMNAVQDMNDKKYSGYNTKAPLIMFDGDFEYSKKVLDNAEIQQAKKKAMNQLVTGPLVAQGMGVASLFAAQPIIDNRIVEKQMIEYKREHPNSNMSDAELKKMFKQQLKEQRKQQ